MSRTTTARSPSRSAPTVCDVAVLGIEQRDDFRPIEVPRTSDTHGGEKLVRPTQ